MSKQKETQTSGVEVKPQKWDVYVVTPTWEWGYEVKERNLKKTLKKLVEKYDEVEVALHQQGSFYWLWSFGKEEIKKLLDGETVQCQYSMHYPLLPGEGIGRCEINLKEVGE